MHSLITISQVKKIVAKLLMGLVEQRDIVATIDIDGVLVHAPIPVQSAIALHRRTFSLPPLIEPYVRRTSVLGRLTANVNVLYHRHRPVKPEALAGLQKFQLTAEALNRKISFAALSGREVHTRHDKSFS